MDATTSGIYTNPITPKNFRMRFSSGAIMCHEVFGHGLGDAIKSRTFDHEDALQLENLYLRVTGYKCYRAGSDHGTHKTLSHEVATPIPPIARGYSFLNDAQKNSFSSRSPLGNMHKG